MVKYEMRWTLEPRPWDILPLELKQMHQLPGRQTVAAEPNQAGGWAEGTMHAETVSVIRDICIVSG